MTGVFVRVVGWVVIRHDMEVVTDSLHRLAKVLWLDRVGQAHHRGPGGEIDRGAVHLGLAGEHALDAHCARGAGHSLYFEGEVGTFGLVQPATSYP